VAAAGLRVRVPGGWGILFVGRWGILDVRAWRGGLAGDLGSSGAAGDAREEEGRGERALPGGVGWSERGKTCVGGRAGWAACGKGEGESGPREGNRAARKGGRVSGGRKREGGNGPAREKGRPKRKKGSSPARLGSRFAILFLSLFFSNPFETQIYLNSNGLLNSNPVHSFQ
jgi:hypothetical protein